jgi:hypothetical protein
MLVQRGAFVKMECAHSVRALFTPLVQKIPGTNAMNALKITLVASIGAFLFGSASVASDLAVGAEVANSYSEFKCGTDTDRSDPDAPEGYSRLGIAKINGKRVAIYTFQNGAKPDDVAGDGQGYADVFDGAGHLIRRFSFRDNLNSPPRITEYVPLPGQ